MFFNLFRKKEISTVLPVVRGKYKYNVSMKKKTRFRVGGEAEVVFYPEDAEDLKTFLLNKPHNMPFFVLGSGSNILVRDGGIVGAVIKLSERWFRRYEIKENKLTCYAGLKNSELFKIMCEKGLSGLEFLCTIPGTIGGSVRSNAGCFGYSVSDFLDSALIIDSSGEEKEVHLEDLKLGYRSSLFPDDWIVLAITFNMKKASAQEIKKKIKEYETYRKEHQPYDKCTAGSFFKNPAGLKAWQLIKKCGCDKLKSGGAEVSDVHCNFIINSGDASAEDIENLSDEIIKIVKEKTSVQLETEVKKVGIKK